MKLLDLLLSLKIDAWLTLPGWLHVRLLASLVDENAVMSLLHQRSEPHIQATISIQPHNQLKWVDSQAVHCEYTFQLTISKRMAVQGLAIPPVYFPWARQTLDEPCTADEADELASALALKGTPLWPAVQWNEQRAWMALFVMQALQCDMPIFEAIDRSILWFKV